MLKYFLPLFLLFATVDATSQDSSSVKFRLFAGPELNFVTGGALSKGCLAGVNVGMELNKKLSSNVGFTTGLSYNYQSTDRWLTNNANFTNSKLYIHMLEIPLGLKFTSNTGAKNNAFFAKAEYINGFSIYSNMVNSKENTTDFSYTLQESTGVVSLYNPGAKVELGVQTTFNSPNSYTFSFSAKQMFLNAVGGSGPKLSTLGLGLNMGYIF